MSNRVIEPANGSTIISAFELQDAMIPITANEDNFVPVVLIAGEIHAIRRITFHGNHSQLIIETEEQP